MSNLRIDEIIHGFAKDRFNKTAIEYGEEKVSYGDLNNISGKIANFLIDQYKDERNVSVIMEKGPELIEAMIGIIKSGGVFVPVEHTAPDNRILTIINEINSKWIITTPTLLRRVIELADTLDEKINILLIKPSNEPAFNSNNVKVFFIGDYTEDKNKDYKYCTNKHCYIYFTSGSTGKPKGVLGRYRSLMQFIEWEIKEMAANEDCRVSQLTPISFDPFLRDVLLPLCSGGTLCIPENQDFIINPIKLVNWIEEKTITHIHMVPSLFKMMINEIKTEESFRNLKYILLAGELLRGNDIKRFIHIFDGRIQLVNLYGPTETTLAKVFYKIKKGDMEKSIIPVGKPIDFAELYILDDELKKCDVGMRGNIYIRTPFISSGYYNDKELTKKVFSRNPFTDNPNDIIYKTGDLGKRLIDGNVEVIGRADNQVKIRGMRIELGEIENRLLQLEYVKEVVVIAKTDEFGVKYLCAYLVMKKELSLEELKGELAKYLPDYMIPAYFIQVDEMPLNANGKIDRKRLLLIENRLESKLDFIEPENDIEKELAAIWSRILNVSEISTNRSFFDYGGHSLKAANLIAEIYKQFNVEMSFINVFKEPTVKRMAEYIAKADKREYEEISKAEQKECYETSSAQKRMYMLQHFDLKSVGYNMPRALFIKGKFNKEKLEKVFNKIIERQESLRTSFENIEGEIVQKVNDIESFKIEYIKKEDKDIKQLFSDFVKAFDLSKAPLLRVAVAELEQDKFMFMFDMHHIISDGVSMSIFINEFICLYEEKELEKLKLQYKDYSEWQNSFLSSERMKRQEEYWISRFSDEVPVLNLPLDYMRPSIQSLEGSSLNFKINKELTGQINTMAQATGTTAYIILLSCINILLSKLSGQEDIIIGSPISGRSHLDLANIIGMFVNTLAMRNFPEGSKSYKEFLLEVKENSLKAYQNQDYQFEELINKLNLHRDISRNPLFDVMFTMQNMEQRNIKVNDLTLEEYEEENDISKFDMTFTAIEEKDTIRMSLQYCTKLFKEGTAKNIIGYLIKILTSVVSNSEIKIRDIDMLSFEEKKKMLLEFNNTEVDYAIDRTIHQLFEEQVKIAPDNIAIVYQNKALTYKELNEKSNKVARMLKDKGIGPDCVIGIMVERSLEMIIGIMGILKSGGAYLPIDPDYPEERIKYLLNNSATAILLSSKKLKDKSEIKDKEVIAVDEFLKNSDYSVENLDINYPSERLMYVLYTSGSTGKPKGVMVKSNSFVNLLNWFTKDFNINNEDNILLIAPAGFDLAQKNLYASLIRGGKLFLFNAGLYDYNLMSNVIEKEKITLINCTPSAFQPLIDLNADTNFVKLKSLRAVYLGGEPINLKKLEQWVQSENCNSEIVNTYGPTECTDISNFYRINNKQIKELNSVPIGKPIYNTKLYVLDKNKKLLPIGAVGELYIGGVGVSRGYYNNSELTKERFVYCEGISESLLYKTGDMVKWLDNGNIEFLGRIDNQVKIRGFRIELGEIEAKLISHEKIKEAVVIDRKDKQGGKYLCGYLVSDESLDIKSLKEYMKKDLPDYMVPAYFIRMDKLPLTPNGKIDRKALPEQSGNINTEVQYEEARNPIEEKMIKVWREILGIEKIGINDNFFDLGGDSLKVIRAVSLLEKQGIELSINDIFKYQNIRDISSNMVFYKEAENSKLNSLDATEVMLNSEFNFEIRLKAYKVYNKKHILLFISDDNYQRKADVLEVMKTSVSKVILPHYACMLSRLKDHTNNQLELKELYDIAGIITDKDEEIYNGLKEEFDNQIVKFHQGILKGEKSKEYSLSAVQQITRRANITLSGTSINFKGIMDYTSLERSVLTLIKRYGLLRSIIVKVDNELKIREFVSPEKIELPMIDLSAYDYYLKEKVITELVESYYLENSEKEMEITDKILYKVLVVKINERDFRVYLPFNHIIFDGMSGEIIKESLINLYENNGFEVCHSASELDYEAYVQQINKGPQQIDEEGIIETFELDKYSRSIEDFHNLLSSDCNKEYRRKEFVFKITDEIREVYKENSWEIAFALFIKLLERNFQLKRIPIRILYFGRQYMDKNYFNVLGEFLDAVPTVLEVGECNTELLSKVNEKIRTASKHNINFANVIYNKEFAQKYNGLYEKLNGESFLEVYSPIFNYVGSMNEYHRLEATNISCISNAHEDIDLAGFMVTITASDEFMVVDGFCKTDEKEEMHKYLEDTLAGIINEFKGCDYLLK